MLVIFTDNHSNEISKDKAISNCSSFMDQVTLIFCIHQTMSQFAEKKL